LTSESVNIDRRKLFEQVAAHIERQILDGTLKAGDRLPPERDLQARFGVGRPAIREALISLQKAGLLELSNGAPARVAMPTASGILAASVPAVLQILSTPEGQGHFQGVRLFFETGLARQAATTATADDLTKLRAALEANCNAIGDRVRFIETDVAFHFVLAEMTRNPVFTALHDAISEWLRSQRVVTLEVSGQEHIACAAHRAIYEAIAGRDPDAAEAAMRQHLEQLSKAFWHQYAAEQGDAAAADNEPAPLP
jgi:GntR family transcriptional repressor for pyruvate dehydrogenase complex